MRRQWCRKFVYAPSVNGAVVADGQYEVDRGFSLHRWTHFTMYHAWCNVSLIAYAHAYMIVSIPVFITLMNAIRYHGTIRSAHDIMNILVFGRYRREYLIALYDFIDATNTSGSVMIATWNITFENPILSWGKNLKKTRSYHSVKHIDI